MSNYSKQIEEQIKALLHKSEGLITKSIGEVVVCYMNGMIDNEQFNLNVLGRIFDQEHFDNLEQLAERITIGDCQKFNQLPEAIEKLISGYALVFLEGRSGGLLVNVISIPTRSSTTADTESTIYGPKIAFTESMEKNTALLRSIITTPELVQEQIQVGADTNTLVSIIYLNNSNTQPLVELIRKRLKSTKIKGVIGSPFLLKLLSDKKYTIFPEMNLTERPDRTTQAILENKVVVMVEGNSQVIIGPSTFFDFFLSVEDRYSTWGLGMFNRLIRVLALFISIYLTPMYVAALTFHYELIPVPLLEPLISSRSRVPFPPLIEALLMEVSIDLLREAGARLPTKVGQTMGIVGGIVIGQAAVQAGFTSNIMILLVALAALGSFTTPNYMMSSTIRFIRYPMLILSGLLGLIGVVSFTVFFMTHLLKTTSYGKPYLYPVYPATRKGMVNAMLISDQSRIEFDQKFTRSIGPSWKQRMFKIMKSKDEE